MLVCIEPGQNCSATGGAKGGGDIGIFQVCPFAGEPIHMGRFQPRNLSGEAHEVVAVIIAKNENNTLGLRGLRA